MSKKDIFPETFCLSSGVQNLSRNMWSKIELRRIKPIMFEFAATIFQQFFQYSGGAEYFETYDSLPNFHPNTI